MLQVLGTVVGLDFETFDGLPYKFLLIVGTFEVFVDDFFPFFGRYWWELAEQFVVFHYVVFFYFLYAKKQRYNFFLNTDVFFFFCGS